MTGTKIEDKLASVAEILAEAISEGGVYTATQNSTRKNQIDLVATDDYKGAIADANKPTATLDTYTASAGLSFVGQDWVSGEDATNAEFSVAFSGKAAIGDVVRVTNVADENISVIVTKDNVDDVLESVVEEINGADGSLYNAETATGNKVVLTAIDDIKGEVTAIPTFTVVRAKDLTAGTTVTVTAGKEAGEGQWRNAQMDWSFFDEDGTEYKMSELLKESIEDELSLLEIPVTVSALSTQTVKAPFWDYVTPFVAAGIVLLCWNYYDWSEYDLEDIDLKKGWYVDAYYNGSVKAEDLVIALNNEDWEGVYNVDKPAATLTDWDVALAKYEGGGNYQSAAYATSKTAIYDVTCGVGFGGKYSSGAMYEWANNFVDKKADQQLFPMVGRSLLVDAIDITSMFTGTLYYVQGQSDIDDCFARPGTYTANFRYYDNNGKLVNKNISVKVTNDLYIPKVTATSRTVETLSEYDITDALSTDVDMNSNESVHASVFGLFGGYDKKTGTFDDVNYSGSTATVRYVAVKEDGVFILVPLNASFKQED